MRNDHTLVGITVIKKVGVMINVGEDVEKGTRTLLMSCNLAISFVDILVKEFKSETQREFCFRVH